MSDLIQIDPNKVDATRAHGTQVVQWAEQLSITTQEDFAEAQSALIVVRDGKKKVTAWIKGIIEPFADAVKNAKANLSPLLEPYAAADEIATKKLQAYIDAEREKARLAAEAEKNKREAEAKRNKDRMNYLLSLGFKWMPENDWFAYGDIHVRTAEISKDNESLWAEKMKGIAEEVEHIKALAPKQEVKEPEAAPAPLPELTVPKPVVQPDFTVKTANGTAYTQKRWTFDENTVDLALVPREYLKLNEVALNKAIAAGTREVPGVRIYEAETLVTRAR